MLATIVDEKSLGFKLVYMVVNTEVQSRSRVKYSVLGD